MNIRLLIALGATLFLLGCSQEKEEAVPIKTAMETSVSDTTRADQVEVLRRLRLGNMTPRVKPVTRIAASMIQAMESLPQPPLNRFYLDIEDERMVMVEFPTVDLAKQMEAGFEDGFRFRNWYFGGMITVDTTRKMQDALGT